MPPTYFSSHGKSKYTIFDQYKNRKLESQVKVKLKVTKIDQVAYRQMHLNDTTTLAPILNLCDNLVMKY